MAKQSHVDKVITQLEGEIAVLQMAVAKLKQQKTTAAKAKPVSTKEKS